MADKYTWLGGCVIDDMELAVGEDVTELLSGLDDGVILTLLDEGFLEIDKSEAKKTVFKKKEGKK